LVLLSCLLAALVIGVAACGDDDEEATAPAGGEAPIDLQIGDIVPLTGTLDPFGPPGRKAADLAVDEIESAIDEAGVDHQVEIQHEDDETDPQAGVAAARSLTGDGATCLAGAWASGVTIPVARSVTSREEVLQISPASTSPQITELDDDGLVNRTVAPDSFQAQVLADFMDQKLGGVDGQTINIGAQNDAYGTEFAEALSTELEALGATVNEPVIFDLEQPSYDSEAQEITDGDPDGTAIITFPETYATLGPALVRNDLDTETTFITDGLADTTLPDEAGDEATEGLSGTRPGTPGVRGEQVDAFDQLYNEAGGPERQTFDAQNFDAVILCYLAAVAAGSTEGTEMAAQVRSVTGPPGDQYTFEELPEAIEALQRGDDIDYEGASGPIDMNEAGDATATVYDVIAFENGEIQVDDQVPLGSVEEEEVAPPEEE
jgi:branched-chain amino acid transport system substrate-binding protein